jgi:exonuclease III
MKIITWNCNMAFRKKAELILAFQPDIVVVPECENLDRLSASQALDAATGRIWYGENPHKGIGIFAFNNYKLELLDCHDPNFRNILPIAVTGGKIDFILWAIWANNPSDKDGAYVTQIWKALPCYDHLLDHPTILIGDFNSNTIWDRPRREGNHSALVAKLEARQILSAYHVFYDQLQGKETHPTLFLYRHRDKPYHLDYCFASSEFIAKLKSVTVGAYEDWSMYSDHKPLVVEFDL